MKLRNPKPDDQDIVDNAVEILEAVAARNPHIEDTLWVSAFFACITNAYINSDVTKNEFTKEMNKAIKIYEKWFD